GGDLETLLQDLVEIPTVSRAPAHAEDIRRGAQTAAALLQACGAIVETVETPGNPVIFGQFIVDPAYPTVAIYNHLDVQPANEPQWQQDPFVFQRDGERYLGRGTTDDKGPALTALLAARFAVQHGVPINVQFLWELEAEIAITHFAVRALRTSWRSDARLSPAIRSWCQTPSGCLAPRRPCPMAYAVC